MTSFIAEKKVCIFLGRILPTNKWNKIFVNKVHMLKSDAVASLAK